MVFSKSFFIEAFLFFQINEMKLPCTWLKKNGEINIFGLIYKHHYLKFTDYFFIEHSAEGQIKLRLEPLSDPQTDSQLYEVESSIDAGVSSADVFVRAVSRYVDQENNYYLLLRNNCEHLCTYSFYGVSRSRQVRMFLFIFLLASAASLLLGGGILVISFIFEYAVYSKKDFLSLEKIKIYCKSFTKFPR